MASLPLFADPKNEEAALSSKFPWQTTKKPAQFDRCGEQMRWLIEIFRSFRAPIRQQQSHQLEIAWWEHMMRIKDEDKVYTKLLDDNVSGASTPIAQVATPVGVEDGMVHSPAGTSEDAAPLPPPGPPPRPSTPRGLPKAEGQAISVRQLLTYLCFGASFEDGLTRATAVLGRTAGGSVSSQVPVAELHAALFQLGARPTPPSLEGDGRPRNPSLNGFCKELGLDNSSSEASMSVKDFMANAQAKRLCERLGLASRHRRPEVEKLFPKNLSPGAKLAASQRIHTS